MLTSNLLMNQTNRSATRFVLDELFKFLGVNKFRLRIFKVVLGNHAALLGHHLVYDLIEYREFHEEHWPARLPIKLIIKIKLQLVLAQLRVMVLKLLRDAIVVNAIIGIDHELVAHVLHAALAIITHLLFIYLFILTNFIINNLFIILQ